MSDNPIWKSKLKIYIPSLLILPYAVILSIYALGPISFSQIAFLTVLAIALGATLFTLFFNIGLRVRVPSQKHLSTYDNAVIAWFRYCSPIILVSSIVFVIWIIRRGTSIEMVLTDTGDVRELTKGSDIVKQISAIFAYQAYGYLPIIFTPWRLRFSTVVNAMMLTSIAIMALAVLLQAGRTFFLVAPALCYAAYVSSPNYMRYAIRRDILLRIIALLMALVGSFFIYIIGVQRVSTAEIENTLISAQFRYFGSFFGTIDDQAAYFFTVIFHYFVGPWSNFNITVLAEGELIRWSLGPLEGILDVFADGEDLSLPKGRDQALARYEQLGGQITGWRTGYGNFIVWYGFFGLPLLASILGFLVGKHYRLARATGSLYFFLTSTWVTSIFLMCLYYFPANNIYVINLVLLVVIVPVFARFSHRARF
jgi:hypothetical protein